MYYKLTNQDMRTHNGCQWKLGETKTTSGEGELCSQGWLHCYDDLLLAIMLNPIHANIKDPRGFETEVGGKCKKDHGLKFGFTEMTITKEVELPAINLTQRIAFGILCGIEVSNDKKWRSWALNWLSGKDRSEESAQAAEATAEWAAEGATRAAYYMAKAAYYVAKAAAQAAAQAAVRAAEAKNLDLKKIAIEAMKYN